MSNMPTPGQLEAIYARDGWRCWRPPTRAEVASATRIMTAHPGLAQLTLKETYLWRVRMAVLKEHGLTWRPQYQGDGTCIGQGGKLAADNSMCVANKVAGVPFVGRAAVAGMYPGSRVDVAGRPGTWQGSTGYWLNQWATKRGGVLLLKHVGLDENNRRDDELLALKWCNSREGVPANMEALARERVLSVGTLCTDPEEAARGIQAGGTLVMCSNLIPTGRRDGRGYSQMRRSGGHCTISDGFRLDTRGDLEGFLYQNSWSENWGTGPTFPDDQPAGSVWVTKAELKAVLAEEDSYMWFGIQGPAVDGIPDNALVL